MLSNLSSPTSSIRTSILVAATIETIGAIHAQLTVDATAGMVLQDVTREWVEFFLPKVYTAVMALIGRVLFANNPIAR